MSSAQRMRELHRWMLLSRLLEEECCRRNPRWFPARGEEATIVGAFYGLRQSDVLAPHYRGPFVVYAMRGAETRRLAGQALGKASGYALGRAVPFTGPYDLNVVPWVAGDLGTSIGVATGAALSIAYGGTDDVVVLTLGDGTSNRGDFHENLNLASVWKLPIVFVVQNNQYSISLHLSTVSAAPIVDRAGGYGIPGVAVDGNDVLAVNEAVSAAVERARSGEGPSLIEAATYRVGGHWAADRALYRTDSEQASWMERDPLALHEERLLAKRILSTDELAVARQAVEGEVAEAFLQAERDPAPGVSELSPSDVLARGRNGA
jgi:acetoin:2,6-dichlorophenolindophenol oxidoreductase subunit alpha